METGQFTIKEYVTVLKGIKLKKATGLDEIPNEVWKMGLFNTYLIVYNQSTIDEWRNGCILPFPKNGDLSNPENYRGITLTRISAKIYNTIMLYIS